MADSLTAGGRLDLARRPILLKWACLAVVALLLSLVGPYGSFDAMDLPARALFWFLLVFGTDLVAHPVAQGLRRLLLPRGWPPLAPRLLAAAVAALPTAFAGSLLWDVVAGQPGGRRLGPGFLTIYGETLLLIVAITLLLGLVSFAIAARDRIGAVTAATPPAAAPALDIGNAEAVAAAEGEATEAASEMAAAFLRRAGSRHAGARLLAVEAEDHYLRIHTDAGDDLVLMRLRDAVAALGAVPGLQVHRSFWVARAAVAQIERRGPAAQIVLAGGLTVPVGRTYMAALREAGWLGPGRAAPD